MRKDNWDKKGPHIPSALGCKKPTIIAFTVVIALIAALCGLAS